MSTLRKALQDVAVYFGLVTKVKPVTLEAVCNGEVPLHKYYKDQVFSLINQASIVTDYEYKIHYFHIAFDSVDSFYEAYQGSEVEKMNATESLLNILYWAVCDSRNSFKKEGYPDELTKVYDLLTDRINDKIQSFKDFMYDRVAAS